MFGNLSRMMKLAAEMKTRLPEMQARLAEQQFTGQAGGGAVKATVNGRLALTDVKIDPSLLAEAALKDSPSLLEDLVKAAVASAQDTAALAVKDAMTELTGGMSLPGLDGLI